MRLHVTVTGRTGPQAHPQGGVTEQMHWRDVAPERLGEVFAEVAANIHDAPLFRCSGSIEILVQAQSEPAA